eukprot:c25240_g1_i1 orf=38-2890(+)
MSCAVDQATICYEHACGKNPNNLELMLGLFNCYIRQYAYLKQQQTAMKMYKLVGEERFLLWAICSIQLQVCCGNGEKTLLQLAEALMKKRIDSHGLQELEALLVYISILQQQEKYEVALDALSTKLGKLFSITNDRLRLQGKLLLSLHQYKRAAEVFQEVLQTSSDDWAVFLQFLDASLEGGCLEVSSSTENDYHAQDTSDVGGHLGGGMKIHLSTEQANERLHKADLFVHELQQMKGQELRRVPFLASVEIAKRQLLLRCSKDKCHEPNCAANSREVAVSIAEYFRRFGHMLSCASDVEDFLDLLKQQDRIWLVEQLHNACGEYEDENTLKKFRRKIVVHELEVLLGLKAALPDKGIIAEAVGIAKLYIGNLELSKDLDPQESVHGEELLTFATSLLIELFLRTKQFGYLIEAILVLEFGLSVRRHTFQYKIMLINLYCTLSAVSIAFDLYKTLDIKNILIETLSHHIIPSLVKSTCWMELDSVLKEATKFYEDYQREAADLTILAYRHCNYSKVLEFVQFKERLQHSHNLLLARAEDSILKLKQKSESPEDLEAVLAHMSYGNQSLEWSQDEKLIALSFNEDLKTRPWWSPAPDECLLAGETSTFNRHPSWHCRVTTVHQIQREERCRSYIQRRCLLPRLIYLSMRAASGCKGGSNVIIEPVALEMELRLQHFVATFGCSWDQLEDLISSVASTNISLKDVKVHAADLMASAVFWMAYQIASAPNPSHSQISRSFKLVNALLKTILSELTRATVFDCSDILCSTKVIAPGSALLSLVCLTTEPLAWLGICLQVWLKCLQPVSKKKKKVMTMAEQLEDPTHENPSLYDVVQNFVNLLSEQLEKLVSWLAALLENSEESSIDRYLTPLNMGREPQNDTVKDPIPSPGFVICALESAMAKTDDLGPRIGQALQTWQAKSVLKRLVSSQHTILLALKESSLSRLKSLRTLRT